MADSQLGQGAYQRANQSYSGPLRLTFATDDTDDHALSMGDPTNVIIESATSAGTVYYLTLPPVAEAHGRTYTFLKVDSGTDSVLVVPHGFISSTLDGGDSADWEGSTGYDFDTQYDSLILISDGVKWHNPATAAIA